MPGSVRLLQIAIVRRVGALGADAPPHAPDECVLEKVGEPVGRVLRSLRILQLLPRPQDPPRDACDGIGHHEQRVDDPRTAGGGRVIEWLPTL